MRRVYAAYLGLGIVLAPLPLLNVLQAESAAVVAFVAFFVAGFSALAAFGESGASVGRVLLRQEVALGIPLAVLTVAQLWAPNCTFGQGLLFFALFPGVTVVLAVAVAYALTGAGVSRPRFVLVLLGSAIAVGGPVYDLGFHPQFYTYNHVFGGVLGPIYDEQLAIRPGLFAFRTLTLLWAAAALLLGRRLRGLGRRWPLPVCALAIGVAYLFSAPLGFNSPAWYLREQLGGHVQTEHFDLYYDPDRVRGVHVEELVETHELQLDWVRRRLGTPVAPDGQRIQSYIYPSRDVKGRLTGARSTSVSPVWLEVPQVHLLRDRVGSSLGHELAHVASRLYGLPGLNASWAPGLVEGWAVALEPPTPGPSPDDLVLTAATSDSTIGLRAEAAAVADRLSPWGFWTGRGAVSYATMGSFIGYLVDRFGPEPLRKVYAWGNFESVYGQSLSLLAQEWARSLQRASVMDRTAHDVVNHRFTRPSLFEVRCPHYVPPARRHLQAATRAMRDRDTLRATAHLRRALADQPEFAAAHLRLARIRLARGQANEVIQQLDTLSSSVRTPGIRVALADAWALVGAADSSRVLYADAVSSLPTFAADTRARIFLRDAVADRAEIVRVLVSADSAAAQAGALGRLPFDRAAVGAWQAIRLIDGGRFDAALRVWRTVRSPLRAERPDGWRREWTLQKRAWMAESALRSDSLEAAGDLALAAARQARALGDRARARRFEWWRALAEEGAPWGSSGSFGTVRHPSRSEGASNHGLRLSVEMHSRLATNRGPSLPPARPSSPGACRP